TWDPSSEKVTYIGRPVEGARAYGKAVRAKNGLIYGSANDTVFVFDPKQKNVVAKLSIESQQPGKSRMVLSESLGSDGLVYGVDNSNGKLFCIDPLTNKLSLLGEDPSLRGARFAEVKEDGYLYYPNHSMLMRVKVIYL